MLKSPFEIEIQPLALTLYTDMPHNGSCNLLVVMTLRKVTRQLRIVTHLATTKRVTRQVARKLELQRFLPLVWKL